LFVPTEERWGSCGIEGVRDAGNALESHRDELGRFAKEACDGLRHDTAFLRARAPLDQHLEIEFLARQPLESVLTDRPELPLVHVPQQALLEVGVAEAPRVIIPKHALDLGCRQDLTDYVEDRVVV